MSKSVTKIRRSSSAVKKAIKRKLLAHIAGYDNIGGRDNSGLLERAVKAIKDLYNSGQVDNIDKAINHTLKLLPYVLEREDTRKLSQLQTNNSGGLYIQLNYLSGSSTNIPESSKIPQNTQNSQFNQFIEDSSQLTKQTLETKKTEDTEETN